MGFPLWVAAFLCLTAFTLFFSFITIFCPHNHNMCWCGSTFVDFYGNSAGLLDLDTCFLPQIREGFSYDLSKYALPLFFLLLLLKFLQYECFLNVTCMYVCILYRESTSGGGRRISRLYAEHSAWNGARYHNSEIMTIGKTNRQLTSWATYRFHIVWMLFG